MMLSFSKRFQTGSSAIASSSRVFHPAMLFLVATLACMMAFVVSVVSPVCALAADDDLQAGQMQAQNFDNSITSKPVTDGFSQDASDGQLSQSGELGVAANSSAPTSWSRLFGNTALDTMASIVQTGWNKSDVVVVSTIEGYWDALSASSLAGANGAPVLFTDRYQLSAQTKSIIAQLGAKKAYIVGGSAAVSEDVAREVAAMGIQTERLWGNNAAGTAVAIADAVSDARADTCVIATSAGYWDALTASPYAYANTAPIYLTNEDGTLDGPVVDAIKAGGYKNAVIAGGAAAVKESVEGQLQKCGIGNIKRCWGNTAFDTAADLARWEVSQGLSWSSLGVATGNGYWDALAGAALCGINGSVLLLADDSNSSSASAVLSSVKDSVGTARVFGGPAAVSETAYFYLMNATNGGMNIGGYWTGTWDLIEMEQNGEITGSDDLAMLKSLGLDVYLKLNADGMGALVMFGESMDGKWVANSADYGLFCIENQAVSMKIAGNKLSMEQNGSRLTFAKR